MSKPASSHSSNSEALPSGYALGVTSVLTLTLKAVFILLCIAVLSLLAATRLFHPLEGDGALFLTAAKMLDEGAVLYVDFWDVKQPGIFYFFWAAGRLFGFSMEAVHLLEFAYWAAMGGLMAVLLRPFLARPWLAAVAPLAFLGTYYGYAPDAYHAQVEIIASGPLFLSAILLAGAAGNSSEGSNWRLVLAGVFGAFVVLLKLVLAPILIAFFIVHIALRLRERVGVSVVMRDAALVSVGGLAVLLVVASALYLQGALEGGLEATFVIGPEWAFSAQEAPLYRLMSGAISFFLSAVVWAGFAIIGLSCAWSPKRLPLTLQCVAWIAAALVCILIQRFSWWPYHWQLFYLPGALLAMLGADYAMDWLERRAILDESTKVAVAIVALFPILGIYMQIGAERLLLIRAHKTEIARGDYDALRAAVSGPYSDALDVVGALPESGRSGTIYVMGDPLVYVIAGKEQAVPVNGWALEFFSTRSWERLEHELRDAKPESIFLATYYEDLLDTSATAIRDLLDSNYHVGSETQFGDWYLLGQVRGDE
jgi:hypothetical protein